MPRGDASFEPRLSALNASAIPDLIEVEHLAIPHHRVRYAGVSGPASEARTKLRVLIPPLPQATEPATFAPARDPPQAEFA